MKEMNIELTSDINKIDIMVEFCWENALYFKLNCAFYTQYIQEYDVIFPEKKYSNNIIKLNTSYSPIIKEKIVVQIDRPDQHKEDFIKALKKECVYILQKEMKKKYSRRSFITQIFENENFKLK